MHGEPVVFGELAQLLEGVAAATASLVLALGTFILRGHIERHLPEPITSPTQLQRWQNAVDLLLRRGYFRPE